jgi:hypothetical protein
MKFTVDTLKKRITIHGSFTYNDYKKVIEQIPEEWVVFEFRGGSEPESVPEMVYPPLDGTVTYPSLGDGFITLTNSQSDN